MSIVITIPIFVIITITASITITMTTSVTITHCCHENYYYNDQNSAPPRGGQLGQSDPGPNVKRGPMPQAQEGPPAQAQERVPQHTDKFIPFTFQMKIKWLNKICYFCLIDPVCLFIERCALARWASAGHTTLSEILSSGSPVKNAMKTSLSSAYRPI